jgi:hypothetical protein
MNIRTHAYRTVPLLLVLAGLPVHGQQPPLGNQDSCRKFAQDFYDWYVPLTQNVSPNTAAATARKIRAHEPEVLSPSLLEALQADDEAQEQAKGELVGLDFDPFVGDQDPADHYEVRKARVERDQCFAEVWRNSPTDTAQKSGKPNVIAVLTQQDGRWRFVNFKYPEMKADLTSVMSDLAKERNTPQK